MVKCHGKEQPAEREGFVLVNDCRRVRHCAGEKAAGGRGRDWMDHIFHGEHEDQTGNGERLSTPNAHPQ